MKTEILPLIVGLSLCGASAVLLYIWYKTKDQEEATDSRATKTSSRAKALPETKVECTIPNNIVPLVVGRSGANIKAIEEKTNTVIRFREKDESNQICEISGLPDNVKRAAELVKQEASPPPNVTEEMYVPQSSCGKIIGRCGEALQEICRKSMAKVHVDAGDRCDGSTRRVLITGTKAHVNIAKSLIDEKIRKDVEAKNLDIETKREPRGSPRYSDDNKSASSDELLPMESEKLNLNKTDGQLEVYISAIASPSRFWLQLVGTQALELDKLVENMTSYYNVVDNQKLHKIADPYLGQIVAAMFKYDGKWYRAEIVGILPNEYYPRDVVLDLYFVDFGDSEYVAPCEVFELRTDFLKLRFQAIECFLSHVQPVNGDKNDTWDAEAISRFEELTHVAKWKKVLARVLTTRERKQNDAYKKVSSSIPGVELFNNTDGLGLNVAHTLISEGYAIPDYPETSNNRTVDTPPIDGYDNLASNVTSSDTKSDTISSVPKTSNLTKTSSQNGIDIIPSPNPTKSRLSAYFSEKDKFSAICENTTNENYENTKIDNRNQSNSLIESERRNGNTSSKPDTLTDNNNTNDHMKTLS